jgi:hypothetical protein
MSRGDIGGRQRGVQGWLTPLWPIPRHVHDSADCNIAIASDTIDQEIWRSVDDQFTPPLSPAVSAAIWKYDQTVAGREDGSRDSFGGTFVTF